MTSLFNVIVSLRITLFKQWTITINYLNLKEIKRKYLSVHSWKPIVSQKTPPGHNSICFLQEIHYLGLKRNLRDLGTAMTLLAAMHNICFMHWEMNDTFLAKEVHVK